MENISRAPPTLRRAFVSQLSMRKLLVSAALVLVAAAGAVAQDGGARRGDASSLARLEEASAEASRLLGSRENRARAWGAYLAGAHGLKAHAPLVVALLEDADAATVGSEEAFVRQAALDALIRLDAEVPSEKLLPLYQLAPDETVILLARAPERNAGALLTLFADETTDARWLAFGNLLGEARAGGFAARLLAGLEMHATVFVYDRKAERGYNGGYGGGCGESRHFFEPTPEGFPPAGHYALTASPARGAVVVARGRRAVYYVRTVPGQGGVPYLPCEDVQRDDHRVEYLAELLRTTSDDLGLEARAFHTVVCRDERQCSRALAALRDETARAYAEVLGRLVRDGLLDASEASTLKPNLILNLYDQRDRRTFPLPEKLDGVRVYVVGGAVSADEADDAPSHAARP